VASEIVTVTVTWKSVPNMTETGPTPTHVQAKFKGTVPIPKQHELEAKQALGMIGSAGRK
jgi:hypothetical protein